MNYSQKKPKNKIIGVTLDDVLRDFTDKFVEMYNETYPDQQIPEDQIKSISPYKINHFFNNDEEMDEFLYENNVADIYGFANEKINGIVNDLSHVNEVMKENGFELMIISKEKNKSIPATLMFLSKTFCKIKKITFVDSYDEMLKYVDYLVTTSTYFSSRNKKIIKVEREYNKKYNPKLTIKEIKYLPKILEKININI